MLIGKMNPMETISYPSTCPKPLESKSICGASSKTIIILVPTHPLKHLHLEQVFVHQACSIYPVSHTVLVWIFSLASSRLPALFAHVCVVSTVSYRVLYIWSKEMQTFQQNVSFMVSCITLDITLDPSRGCLDPAHSSPVAVLAKLRKSMKTERKVFKKKQKNMTKWR